jgi:hypothetical protein
MTIESNQENLVLKKRLNTCRTSNGRLSRIPTDLVVDIVKSWERWPGSAKNFYQSLGIKKQQLAAIIKKGKRLFKEGNEQLGAFTPIEVPVENVTDSKTPIILRLDKNKSIRFYQVSHLVEFLKKVS